MADNTVVEISRIPNNLGDPEKLKSYPNLKFESGDHGSTNHIVETVTMVRKGDLTPHTWNPEVATRIREYHPQLLAIDGIMAGLDYKSALANSIFWAALPDRPSAINPSGKILVIAGDQARFTEAISPIDLEMAGQLQELERRDLFNINLDAESDVLLNASAVVELAIGLASVAPLSKEKFTRRGLFRRVAAVATGGLAVLGSKYLKDARFNTLINASFSTTEPEKDLALTIADYIGPKFIKEDWTRARTAMEILKTKDAIDILGLPKDTPAAVVMGNSHSFEAKGFMKSEEACQAAIQNYFKKLQKVVRSGAQKAFEGTHYSADQFLAGQMDKLVHYIAKTEIYEVTDPGEILPGQKLDEVLAKNINIKSAFDSPRVLQALR